MFYAFFFDENKILHTIHSSFLPSYMYTLPAHTANFFGEPSSSSSLFNRRDSRSSALSPSGRRSSSSPKLIHTFSSFVETSSGRKVVTHSPSSSFSCWSTSGSPFRREGDQSELSTRKKTSRARTREKKITIVTNSISFGLQQPTPEGLFAVTALTTILIMSIAKAKQILKTNTMNENRKKVVIIGGGFAGMQAVFDLAKTCDVTLVDTKAYFEYTPGALSAMVGGGPMRRYKGSENSGERIGRLHQSYEKMCERVGARFAHAADDGVKSVCEEYVSVRMADEGVDENKKLEYDYLIIATGSNYGGGPLAIKPMGGTPGEGAKTGYARQKTFQRNAERIVMPSSHYNNHDDGKTTLIVGGGVVGVELAADIACMRAKSSSSKGTTTTTSVVLAHDKNRLLDTLPKSASEYVENWFKKKNVRVELGQRFERVNDDASLPSYVGSKDKTVKIQANETIFAIGSKPSTNFLSFENPTALRSAAEAKKNGEQILEIPLSKLGFIERDPKTLQVIGFENIYAVGDCAMKPPGQFLASFAHWEAEYVATRIKREERGRKKTQVEYFLPPRFMAISLGSWNGLFLWGNLVLCKGVLAAVVKFLVEVWFSNFFPAPYAFLCRLPKFEFASKEEEEEKIQSPFGKSSLA